jgi:hypothetical protein
LTKEWLVGPIEIEDGIGKEFISRFSLNETVNQVSMQSAVSLLLMQGKTR